MNVLLRTDGSRQLGNGHIIRMLALAGEFQAHSIACEFAVRFDEFWMNKINGNGFDYTRITSESEKADELQALLQEKKITHLIYDTRGDLTREELAFVKARSGVKVVVIDSPEDTRLEADTVIYPPIPQVREWTWAGFTGKIFSGWEYVMLRREFTHAPVSRRQKSGKILLAFGSTDPFHMSEAVIKKLSESRSLFADYEFQLLAGPQFDRSESIRNLAEFKSLNISLVQSPDNLAALFSSVDFAFISFGVTAYELASLSVPFVCISISEDHERSCRVFEEQGLCASLGLINNFAQHFAGTLSIFMRDYDQIQTRISRFNKLNKIGDWNSIIKAIK